MVSADGSIEHVKLSELLMTRALDQVPADHAGPGDIVAIAGIRKSPSARHSPTRRPASAPLIHVDEPSISMTIGINTSPLAGESVPS